MKLDSRFPSSTSKAVQLRKLEHTTLRQLVLALIILHMIFWNVFNFFPSHVPLAAFPGFYISWVSYILFFTTTGQILRKSKIYIPLNVVYITAF
jgi:hypothetical protein